jgi:exodeoxyribonuclease VII small subunit
MPAKRAAEKSPSDEPTSYEAAQAELQALAQAMESGTLPLAQMLDGYRRASVLLRYCHAQLDAVEQQILQIDGGELKPWVPDAGTL